MNEFSCPLCCARSDFFYQDKRRDYYRCRQCQIVFVPVIFWLSSEDEKNIYDQHENSFLDEGYRKFLSRMHEPMLQKLARFNKNEIRGLDFGCGPGPVLADMFRRSGYDVSLYDLFYYPDAKVLGGRYDFITASEVVEHLHNPRQELFNLWRILEPGGSLGIMTKRVKDLDAFSKWHYKNDLTHIVFFSEETFRWLAKLWSADLSVVSDDVVIFTKADS